MRHLQQFTGLSAVLLAVALVNVPLASGAQRAGPSGAADPTFYSATPTSDASSLTVAVVPSGSRSNLSAGSGGGAASGGSEGPNGGGEGSAAGVPSGPASVSGNGPSTSRSTAGSASGPTASDASKPETSGRSSSSRAAGGAGGFAAPSTSHGGSVNGDSGSGGSASSLSPAASSFPAPNSVSGGGSGAGAASSGRSRGDAGFISPPSDSSAAAPGGGKSFIAPSSAGAASAASSATSTAARQTLSPAPVAVLFWVKANNATDPLLLPGAIAGALGGNAGEDVALVSHHLLERVVDFRFAGPRRPVLELALAAPTAVQRDAISATGAEQFGMVAAPPEGDGSGGTGAGAPPPLGGMSWFYWVAAAVGVLLLAGVVAAVAAVGRRRCAASSDGAGAAPTYTEYLMMLEKAEPEELSEAAATLGGATAIGAIGVADRAGGRGPDARPAPLGPFGGFGGQQLRIPGGPSGIGLAARADHSKRAPFAASSAFEEPGFASGDGREVSGVSGGGGPWPAKQVSPFAEPSSRLPGRGCALL